MIGAGITLVLSLFLVVACNNASDGNRQPLSETPPSLDSGNLDEVGSENAMQNNDGNSGSGVIAPPNLANTTDLTFLGAGPRERIEDAIEPYGGVIVSAVEQVGAYQVRFPVNSLAELDAIRQEFEAMGFNVQFTVEEVPTNTS